MFTGKTELGWLRVLRPGFRHCAALIRDRERWMLVDPLATRLHIEVLDTPHGYNLPALMTQSHQVIVEARPLVPTRVPTLLRPLSCVEPIKHLIGLQDPFILTPFQLYRRLAAEADRHGLPPVTPGPLSPIPPATVPVPGTA